MSSAYPGRVEAAAAPQHVILCDNLVKIYKTAELEVVALQIGGDLRPETIAKFAHGHCVMGMFERGGTVFTTGCTDWAYGLGKDPQVDRVTENVVARLAR